MGLKRYLTDFSLVAERGIKEMPIWRELLTYAMLFGIADQVADLLPLAGAAAPSAAVQAAEQDNVNKRRNGIWAYLQKNPLAPSAAARFH